MAFAGEYFHRLDGKNRIRIPAKFRKAIGDEEFCFMRGTDGCICIVCGDELKKINEQLASVPMSDKEGTRAVRAISSAMTYPEEDSQGRIVLSPEYRKYAGIKEDIVFVGAFSRIEIWDKESYEAYMGGSANADYSEVFKSVGL
ncbi:MAG: division/cell wall cluster transcriptional repressor MraZ [Clostridia bacterium]|nr:division/cell wall cluster transcriptional repressor MraZ [Clostridia bacterium]